MECGWTRYITGNKACWGCCCTHGVSRETAHLTPATRGRCLLPIQESYLKLKTSIYCMYVKL